MQAIDRREALLSSFNGKACSERVDMLDTQREMLQDHRADLLAALRFCENSTKLGCDAESILGLLCALTCSCERGAAGIQADDGAAGHVEAHGARVPRRCDAAHLPRWLVWCCCA